MIQRHLGMACLFASIGVIGFVSTASAQDIKFIPYDSIQWTARAGAPGLASAELFGSVQQTGLYVVQVKFEKGGKAPPHTHPDQRILNVIAGTLYFAQGTEFDEQKLKPFKAGSVILISPNVPHFVMAKDAEVITQESGFGPSGTKPWPQVTTPK